MYLVKTPYLVKKYFSKFVWDIPQSEKVIYLTFDDGPTPNVTDFVLSELDKYQAKATFFCIGNNVKKHPLLFKKIKVGGHKVGNHTFSHLDGKKTETNSYLKDFKACEKEFSSSLFRPPYGRIRRTQYQEILKTHRIIMWDVLSGDFDLTLSEEKCWRNVKENVKGGSIVVFHDSDKAKENVYYSLPKTLSYFFEKGFLFKAIQ